MLMLLLVATIDIDKDQVCAKYGQDYTLPPAAVAAAKECGEGCERDLAEQFANGDGVERDYDAAEYFLCHAEDHMAPAEFDGMFGHLQKMRAGETDEDLEFCDWVTSGYGASYCASVRFDEVMPVLDARLQALRERVKAGRAFEAAEKRALTFAQAEATRIGEQSRGGTGYAAFSLEAEIDEKQRVVEALEKLAAERAPAASAAEFKTADAELNATYRAELNEIDEMKGIVDHVEEWRPLLRDAQRAWIAYRDALAAWYAEEWKGQAAPEALRREAVAQLTRERTARLRD